MTAPAPTPIVPRWGVADVWRALRDIHFAALSPDRVQESDDVYLLSLASVDPAVF